MCACHQSSLLCLLHLSCVIVLTVLGGSHAARADAPRLLSRSEAIGALRAQVAPSDVDWLRSLTRAQLRGCRVAAVDGTTAFTPDGSAHYRALWTRDFAYMVEHAGDLLEPDDVRAAIAMLLRGQRADGCMPDRVTVEGRPVYSPGSETRPLADHALDNGPFMAKLVTTYVRRWNDAAFFREHEPALRRGLDFVRRAPNGLVYNDPARPQCPYGFTDTVAKTGHLLFTSLLYYEACHELESLAVLTGCGEPADFHERADRIRAHLGILWDESAGMFLAADHDCRQLDVWGSALAVDLDVTTPHQRDRILDYLVRHADHIFKRGQVRHLPAPQTWSRMLIPIAPGTYQNGAYWATPHAWLLPTLARRDPELAGRLLNETLRDFRENGNNECINDDYRNVPSYVVSATSVYAILSAGVPDRPASQPASRP